MNLYITILICFVFVCITLSSMALDSESTTSSGHEEKEIISRLLEATRKGDIEGIDNAIENGDDINVVNVNGWSAAAFAVADANIEVLRVLIEHEIDLNTQDSRGLTPLMMAAEERDKELVEVLLEANADPTIQAPDGSDAYSIAKSSRRLLIAAIILEACVIRGMVTDNTDLILKSTMHTDR